MSAGYGFTLAVCAEMVFRDRPFEERVRRIHDLGFAVEIWDWASKDLAALAALGRQALHAYLLALEHPRTGELLHWEAPLPEDLLLLQGALEAAL